MSRLIHALMLAALLIAAPAGCGEGQEARNKAFAEAQLADAKAALEQSGAEMTDRLDALLKIYDEVATKTPLGARSGFAEGSAAVVLGGGARAKTNAKLVEFEGSNPNAIEPKYVRIGHWGFARGALVHLPKLREQVAAGAVESYIIGAIKNDLAELRVADYLVVLKGKRNMGQAQGASKVFTSGSFEGTAYVYTVPGAAFLGGFPVKATNSKHITARQGQERAAVGLDLSQQVRAAVIKGLGAP